ncbi:MAG: T9SS type A sorting domain-containing protein, partial [Bacteroidota bacterium]|nr:T9SS type A sorting domain-containing protein [Bacteroidota bacterium]
RYGGSDAEELRAVIQTGEGDFLLAGKSSSGVSGDRTQASQGGSDFWLVKVAPDAAPIVAAREATPVEESVIKAKPALVNAFPNPFKDQIKVSFTLSQKQAATLKMYDSQGREVGTLFEGEAQANHTYQLQWRAQNKAAGLYLLQLQTPTLRQQKKLLLTR